MIWGFNDEIDLVIAVLGAEMAHSRHARLRIHTQAKCHEGLEEVDQKEFRRRTDFGLITDRWYNSRATDSSKSIELRCHEMVVFSASDKR